jgi:hypothetical protein
MSLIESLDWASPPEFPVLDRARKTEGLLPKIVRRIAAQACYTRSGITPAKLNSIQVV